MDPLNVRAKFEIRIFPIPEIIGCTTENGITDTASAKQKLSNLYNVLTAK